jgi:membrane protein implicated in regulation of membrane protease activity
MQTSVRAVRGFGQMRWPAAKCKELKCPPFCGTVLLTQNVVHARQPRDFVTESTIWWLLTGAAVAVELVTGTFYLLMLAIGLAAGAVAAHLGFGLSIQLVVAAVLGAGTVVAWHLKRGREPGRQPASRNSDVQQDIGATVQVDAWNADGTATITYRGALWTAIPAAGLAPEPGAHRVKELVGSRLVLEKI